MRTLALDAGDDIGRGANLDCQARLDTLDLDVEAIALGIQVVGVVLGGFQLAFHSPDVVVVFYKI
jgi:hypothetical protein